MKYRDIHLKVPSTFDYSLIYRQERREPFLLGERDQLEFVLVRNPLSALPFFHPLREKYGLLAFCKALIRLATRKRVLFFVLKDGHLANLGWCWVSICKHYKIAQNDVILGSIWTSELFRGQGIATYGIKRAMNAMMDLDHAVFYIDTTRDNEAMQRVIANCGFGDPLALFIRQDSP